LKGAALLDVLRLIREEEPPRPSARVRQLRNAESVASIPHTAFRTPHLQELDWVVMKCLEKDRNRRYETASALAQDLQRYLNDEPVQACPPSAPYKMKKFLRRNKKSVLAAALVLLALVGGIIGTTWQAVRATRERDDKDRALAAETEA